MPLTQVSSRAIEDTLRYVLGASGTNHYTFTGKGLNGAVNDPTLTLSRGHTYVFENRNSSAAHPFYIKTSIANGGTNDAYNTGVTNNGGAGGTEIVFTVPHDAPDTLYYQCSSHSSMAGQLNIAGSVADGSITESKLASNSVISGKIADGTVTTNKLANDAVTSTKLADQAVDTNAIQDSAILTSKIADGQINTLKLANEAVTLAKLEHGTSSNDGKFLRANNGADPSFETISQPDLSNLNASNLTSGTVPDARFPAILPAVSGANLTNIPVGINISYAELQDVKGSTTQGGSFTSGAWRTRDLNTEKEDTDNIVTLSSNQFTLGAGNYHISAHACAVGVNNHAIRLYSITNNAIVLMGFSHKNQEENVSEYARLEGRILLGDNMVFEIQHRCSTTVTTHGFGAYGGFGDNIYTTVQIYKRNY